MLKLSLTALLFYFIYISNLVVKFLWVIIILVYILLQFHTNVILINSVISRAIFSMLLQMLLILLDLLVPMKTLILLSSLKNKHLCFLFFLGFFFGGVQAWKEMVSFLCSHRLSCFPNKPYYSKGVIKLEFSKMLIGFLLST